MEYHYLDARDGTKYCAHTDTSPLGVETGAMYRDTIMEGGDHTCCTKRVLGIGALGASRGGR